MNDIEKKHSTGITLHGLERFIAMMPQASSTRSHHFATGVYAREMSIAKGTLLVGKRHREDTINILIKGDLSMFIDEDGGIVGENGKPGTARISAPAVFVSKPFSKKLLYAHEDVVFLTVHYTDTQDVEEIEKRVIIPEHEFLTLLGSKEARLMVEEVAACHG